MFNNIQKPLKSYEGIVVDLSYDEKEVAYGSVDDFINDITEIEINIAINDFANYKDDNIYKKYKRLRDTQKISKKELNELLSYYNYELIR